MMHKSCDAMVVSKKNDHKFIFLKENKPKDITPDKLRFKGKQYIKKIKNYMMWLLTCTNTKLLKLEMVILLIFGL